ncbi:metallo-beta-lactamase family protein [Desulfovibrio sp. TomC]|nr:N-acyl homoserine lactonase family protein [Desulfovibrio sp. TomC]KHK01031.1 metallo-beta-lactamase family protein [Desulfovibrio sp. TomC]
MATFVIHPIVLGTKEFDKGMMTYQFDYGTPYTIPIYGWYLEGGGKRVLVDTGEMRPVQSAAREAAIGGKIHTLDSGLAQFGLTPADIDIVVHTHLHNDHCENDALCENAVFYAHEQELKHIRDPHPLDFRYNEEYVEDVLEAGQMQPLTSDTEILPGLRMVHTPAHTEGGMSVFVDTPAGQAVITGFCVIRENLFPPKAVTAREMEVIPPGTCVNPYAAYDILRRIKSAADIVILLHEPSFATGAPIGRN